MKNKFKILCVLILLVGTYISTSTAAGWPWQAKWTKDYTKCIVKREWNFGIWKETETFEGHKKICVSGGKERCLTGDCMPGPSPKDEMKPE